MERRFSPILLVAGALLCWVGMADSIFIFRQEGGVPGCLVDSDCGRVLESEYSTFAGIPLSWLGFCFYTLTLSLLLVLLCLGQGRLRNALRTGFLVASATALGVSGWLVHVQANILEAWCPFCLLSGLCTLGLFGLALTTRLRDVRPGGRPLLLATGATLVVLSPAALFLMSRFEVPPEIPIVRIEPSPIEIPAKQLEIEPSPVEPPAKQPEPDPPPSTPKETPAPPNPRITLEGWTPNPARALGPEDARLKMIVFSDFECRHCREYSGTLLRLHERFPDDLRIEYRYSPTVSHKKARPAARAAEAAAVEGKFWEFHNKLYGGDALDEETYFQYAEELGLDLKAFRERYASEAVDLELKRCLLESKQTGVRRIPASLLGDFLIQGKRPYELLERIIEEELNQRTR